MNGKSPEKYLPESTGAGCAFLDYDNDGWMDIYLVNSGKCDFYTPDPPLATRCIETIATAPLRTSPRKQACRVVDYGQGVAVGDYDRDGFPDLYVTAVRAKHFVITTMVTAPSPM